jgi:hypothetical protein
MAASAQQIRANRANAQLSTGPSDTSRTKFNGARHGLTSRQTVIPGEDPTEYALFAAGLTAELDPQSEIERLVAERMVAAAWRLRRFTRMETAFFNNRIEAFLEQQPGADPDFALANLFADPAESQRMRLFLRYQTAVQREFDTAQKQYEKARRDRQRQALERASLAEAQELTNAPQAVATEAHSVTKGAPVVAQPDPHIARSAGAPAAIGFASYNSVTGHEAITELHVKP